LPPSDDRHRVGRLSRGCADRGQPIGVGDADSSDPKPGDYYHKESFSTEADPETIAAV
jgi:hypothetical protein